VPASKETVKYYLIHCTLYDKEGMTLMKKVIIGRMWVKILVSHSKLIAFALDFMEEIGRLAF